MLGGLGRLWLSLIALILSIAAPATAIAQSTACITPNPLNFSSLGAAPTFLFDTDIVNGTLQTTPPFTCDFYNWGLATSNGSTPVFEADFTTPAGNSANGIVYSFHWVAINGSDQNQYTVSIVSGAAGHTTDTLTLYFDNDPNDAANSSVAIPITIAAGGAATTTTVNSSINPATFPQTETFTATVTSASIVSESTVTFRSDGSTISGCAAQPVSNGAASCAAQLSAGSHSVAAAFNGDANFTASTSSSLNQIVNAAVVATQAIPSKALTQNHAASFTPVTGSGGTGALGYSVAPPLPSGLSLSASTGAIAGAPTVTLAATTYTVTVTDANGQIATNTFQLTVNSAVTATQAVASRSLTQNHAASSFTPVTGGGGTGSLTYNVAPPLPTGLSFSTTSGAVTGTPSITTTATTYTVTVTDANGATATNTFSLTVNTAVTATQAVASTTLTQNHAPTPFAPVTGGGGTSPLTYSVLPSLPNGLVLSPTTGTISGTPTASLSTTTFSVVVTDANGATATNTFSLTVNPPVIATQAIASMNLTFGVGANQTPVTGSGGTGPLTFSVSPALPSALSMNPSTGAITGNPAVPIATTAFTVTVTDANGATATNTFSLTIVGPVLAVQSIASTTLTVNHAATPFTPVTGTGGRNPLAYSISPALPAGLAMSASTGQITGTPTATSATTTYTVTVTDANGATATNTFSLTVNGAVVATQAIASRTLTENQATNFTPVTGSGGTGALTYSVAPGLPAGLSFSASNGSITGTPNVASATTTYTVTVTDTNGATATNTFSLTVNATVIATVAVASTSLTQNRPATAFTPVTGGGGTGALTYAVAPILPAGMTFSTTTGALAGTPTATSATTSYTVTVTDANGASANASFSLTVNGVVAATVNIPSTTLTQGTAANFTPVTGSSGTAPLAYSVSPGLPTGLSMSPSSGAITGTPTTPSATASYNVTVTDANGSTASASFSLTVRASAQVITFTSTPPSNATVGGPTYSVSATGGGSGNPVTFTIDASATSVCSIAGATVSFIGAGSCVIDANQAGNGIYPPATQVQQSFNVGRAAPTIAVQSSSTTQFTGVPVTFTAIVSGGVTPTGTVTFFDNGTAIGTVALSGGRATLTVSSLSVGTHTIVAVYNGDSKNAVVTSGPTTLTVNARPNPALNPDVIGLTTAEAASAVQYGQTQLSNTVKRLEEIHDEDDDGQSATQDHKDKDKQSAGGAGKPGAAGTGAGGQTAGNPFGELDPSISGQPSLSKAMASAGYGQLTLDPVDPAGQAIGALSAMAPAAVDQLNKRLDLPFHIWYAGALEFGNLTSAGLYSNHFTSSGLTIGVDRRFFDGFRAGVALGLGLDRTDVGTDGTHADSFSYSAAAYASYRFLPHTFLDVIAGYGGTNFSLKRWSAEAGQMLTGTRRGDELFGSVGLTEDFRWSAWKLAPYARLDMVHIDLAPYGEQGSPAWDLSYNALSSTSLFSVAGARVEYAMPMSWGTLTPSARLEYTHTLSGGFTQTLSYTGLPGTNYSFSGTTQYSDLVTGGLGLKAENDGGLAAEIEYLLSGTTRQIAGQQIRASARQAF
jgi:hypothetical protein